MYITAQILSGLSTLILLTYTLIKVNRTTILVCNMIINFLLAVHYLLLGAVTGAVCSFLCVAMIFVLSLKEKFQLGVWVPFVWAGVFLLFGILTWQNIWSVIPILGHFILIAAFWSENEVRIKAMFIIVAFLWCVYNFIFQSWLGLGGQVLSFLLNVYYVLCHLIKQKKA